MCRVISNLHPSGFQFKREKKNRRFSLDKLKQQVVPGMCDNKPFKR
jgi:hypothetical protein